MIVSLGTFQVFHTISQYVCIKLVLWQIEIDVEKSFNFYELYIKKDTSTLDKSLISLT